MYEFRDTLIGSNQEETSVPSDNLLINGRGLNELVKGYRQLSISGRGLISRRLQTTEIPNRGGLWLDDVQDEARELRVHYQLKAPTSEALRDAFWELNRVLREKDVLSISFKDESNFIYSATLSEAEEIQENRLSILSSFTLFCPNPYKYTPIRQSMDGKITLNYANKVLPERIKLSIIKESTSIKIKCAGKTLSLKGTYQVGDEIELRYEEDAVEIRQNNRLILNDLELYQPLEEFYLYHGSTVSATNAEVVLVEWRDKRL